MGCDPIHTGDEVVGFVCSRGQRRAKTICVSCGERVAEYECDAPSEGGRCDAPICRVCRTSTGPGYDLCPLHVAVDPDEVEPDVFPCA